MLAALKRALHAIAQRWKTLVWILPAIYLAVVLTRLGRTILLRKFVEWQRRSPNASEIAVLVFAAGVFLIILLWLFPKWQVRSLKDLKPEDRFDRENEARKTLSQILGGLVFLIGFFFTWQNLAATYENLRIASEGQTTERFTKAIAQLGDDKNLEVRLGGIYALELIANDPRTDLHEPIMQILTAFVRDHARIQQSEKPAPETQLTKAQESTPRPAPDIQAALTVLGSSTLSFRMRRRRLLDSSFLGEDEEPPRFDLRETDLRGANLEEAFLVGSNFQLSNLSHARLVDAILSKALLNEANLSGADLERTDLSDANLSGARLEGAELNDADLRDADLSSALGLRSAQIESANGNTNTKLPPNIPRPKSWR